MSNPYASLRALLDATRELAPEEMAELMLEQGYVERAVAIYDQLVREQPRNAAYRTRREWLRRLVSVQARPIRPVQGLRRVRRPVASVDGTLRGAPAPGHAARAKGIRAPDVRSAETRPAQARPAQARPAQARPAQARPAQARADHGGSGRANSVAPTKIVLVD